MLFKTQMFKANLVQQQPQPQPQATSQSPSQKEETKSQDHSKPVNKRVKILEALSKQELKKQSGNKAKLVENTATTNGSENGDNVQVGPEDFEYVHVLGRGSFGEVFLVKYKKTGKYYAMKILDKRKVLTQNMVKYARTERNVLCFTKHPFIVGCEFAFQTANKLFMIMDYCPGGDLGRVVQKEKEDS
jgi:hypothetical protein